MQITLTSLLLVSSFAMAAPVSIEVVPSGVSVRFDMKKKEEDIVVPMGDPDSLVEVGLVLKPSDGKTVLNAGKKDAALVCTDSTGKDLGSVEVKQGRMMAFVMPPGYSCSVCVREAPAPEARWIHVKGTVPVKALDGEEKRTPFFSA